MIKISGLSNDVVSIESDFGDNEEIAVEPGRSVAITLMNTHGQGVDIVVWYEGPTWGFSILQLEDEETEVPWPISIDQDSTYSLAVEIQCGEDVKWTHELHAGIA